MLLVDCFWTQKYLVDIFASIIAGYVLFPAQAVTSCSCKYPSGDIVNKITLFPKVIEAISRLSSTYTKLYLCIAIQIWFFEIHSHKLIIALKVGDKPSPRVGCRERIIFLVAIGRTEESSFHKSNNFFIIIFSVEDRKRYSFK